MDTAAQILVIIVSSVLTIFLIILIVALVYFIKLVQEVRRVVSKAERVAMNVESAADLIGRTASPLGFIKLVGTIVDQVTKYNKRKG